MPVGTALKQTLFIMSNKNNIEMHWPSKVVAVVVPLHNKEGLTAEEEISKNHLVHYLGKYDKYMIAPKNLNVSHQGFEIVKMDEKFFGSISANRRMMFSRAFYEVFQDYKYILIYHLDALVLSDQLEEWCGTDVDYIGAPWFNSEYSPHIKDRILRNGGFSLRKVSSFMKIIDSKRYALPPNEYWERYFADKPKFIRFVNLPRKYIKHLMRFNNVQREMHKFRRNEDRFWSGEAVKYYPEFSVAPFELALKFAFEVAPRKSFQMNNNTLPFGCHAWARYDKDFWEPYLLR